MLFFGYRRSSLNLEPLEAPRRRSKRIRYKPDIISKLNKLDSSEACCHI